MKNLNTKTVALVSRFYFAGTVFHYKVFIYKPLCFITDQQNNKRDSAHLNKQHSSENEWSEIKCKGDSAFGNFVPTNVKAPCPFISYLKTKDSNSMQMEKKQKGYTKFRLD